MQDLTRVTVHIIATENVPDTVEEWDELGLAKTIAEIHDAIESYARYVVSAKLAKYNATVKVD